MNIIVIIIIDIERAVSLWCDALYFFTDLKSQLMVDQAKERAAQQKRIHDTTYTAHLWKRYDRTELKSLLKCPARWIEAALLLLFFFSFVNSLSLSLFLQRRRFSLQFFVCYSLCGFDSHQFIAYRCTHKHTSPMRAMSKTRQKHQHQLEHQQ